MYNDGTQLSHNATERKVGETAERMKYRKAYQSIVKNRLLYSDLKFIVVTLLNILLLGLFSSPKQIHKIIHSL